MLIALGVEAWRLGVTVDEPSHLLSSYLYWHGRDNLRPHDMPPLIKLAGGWVPRLFGIPVPGDLGRPGDTRQEWAEAATMIESMSGARIQTVFFFARMTLAVFPLLTALLLWRWGRRLFGPATGLLLMLLFALEPTALAHGSLFKNDLASTFGYTLFWYTAWLYWRDPRPARAGWMGAAALLALAGKMSMLMLAPAAPVVVLLRARKTGTRAALPALALVLLIPYVGLLALYQFDTRRVPGAELHSAMMPLWVALPAIIFRVLPVPANMWHGFVSLLGNDTDGAGVYLLGHVYPHGNPFYFLIALAVKVPVPLQLLLCAGVAAIILGAMRRRLEAADVFWLLPGFLYIGTASFSSLQLGVRLVLPALPFGLLLCGAAIHRFWLAHRPLLPCLLAGWLAAQTAFAYPHGLSFMNIWAGGAANGPEYLSDSNIDWGGGLPDLHRFVHERGIARLRLCYFGMDNIYRYFTRREVEELVPPYSEQAARNFPQKLRPGYYAVSAALLTGQFFAPKYRRCFAPFRRLQPIARVGDTIYVYNVRATM